MGALDTGAGIGEVDVVEDGAEGGSGSSLERSEEHFKAACSEGRLASPQDESLSRGHSLSRRSSHRAPPKARFLLDLNATSILPSETFLRPLLGHPPSSQQEMFEHALQLRMTQVAVAEHVEGSEGAVDRWVEVFSWIAEKRGVGVEHRAFFFPLNFGLPSFPVGHDC